MERGNLVIYDTTGKIFFQTGEAKGDVLPHEYPAGIPFMEIPYGTMLDKRLVCIDVSGEKHIPVFEDIPQTAQKTEQPIAAFESEN